MGSVVGRMLPPQRHTKSKTDFKTLIDAAPVGEWVVVKVDRCSPSHASLATLSRWAQHGGYEFTVRRIDGTTNVMFGRRKPAAP